MTMNDNERIPIDRWGRDHWTTLLYIETRCVDYKGTVRNENLRCFPTGANLHRMTDAQQRIWCKGDEKKYGTRLADDSVAENHDDWDCIEDMVAAGVLLWEGTGAYPAFVLTDIGWQIAHALRRWRAEGKTVKEFRVMRAAL